MNAATREITLTIIIMTVVLLAAEAVYLGGKPAERVIPESGLSTGQ